MPLRVGLFHELVNDKDVRLIRVKAAQLGIDSGKHECINTKRGSSGSCQGLFCFVFLLCRKSIDALFFKFPKFSIFM